MKRCVKCGKLPELMKNEKGQVILACIGCRRSIIIPKGEGNMQKAIEFWDRIQEEKDKENGSD